MKQPTASDPLDIMLAYDGWATRRLLKLCEPLSHEQFHRRFPIGPGSLHDGVTHIIACARRWSDWIDGVALRPMIERMPEWYPEVTDDRERTVTELMELADEAAAGLAGVAQRARERGLGGVIAVTLEGPTGPETYPFTRAAALLHIATHGTHHRAQCSNMLRRLEVPGVSDAIPDFDMTDWQYETECLP
jgi:uncharacterized damage-inducible protein DinB